MAGRIKNTALASNNKSHKTSRPPSIQYEYDTLGRIRVTSINSIDDIYFAEKGGKNETENNNNHSTFVDDDTLRMKTLYSKKPTFSTFKDPPVVQSHQTRRIESPTTEYKTKKNEEESLRLSSTQITTEHLLRNASGNSKNSTATQQPPHTVNTTKTTTISPMIPQTNQQQQLGTSQKLTIQAPNTTTVSVSSPQKPVSPIISPKPQQQLNSPQNASAENSSSFNKPLYTPNKVTSPPNYTANTASNIYHLPETNVVKPIDISTVLEELKNKRSASVSKDNRTSSIVRDDNDDEDTDGIFDSGWKRAPEVAPKPKQIKSPELGKELVDEFGDPLYAPVIKKKDRPAGTTKNQNIIERHTTEHDAIQKQDPPSSLVNNENIPVKLLDVSMATASSEHNSTSTIDHVIDPIYAVPDYSPNPVRKKVSAYITTASGYGEEFDPYSKIKGEVVDPYSKVKGGQGVKVEEESPYYSITPGDEQKKRVTSFGRNSVYVGVSDTSSNCGGRGVSSSDSVFDSEPIYSSVEENAFLGSVKSDATSVGSRSSDVFIDNTQDNGSPPPIIPTNHVIHRQHGIKEKSTVSTEPIYSSVDDENPFQEEEINDVLPSQTNSRRVTTTTTTTATFVEPQQQIHTSSPPAIHAIHRQHGIKEKTNEHHKILSANTEDDLIYSLVDKNASPPHSSSDIVTTVDKHQPPTTINVIQRQSSNGHGSSVDDNDIQRNAKEYSKTISPAPHSNLWFQEQDSEKTTKESESVLSTVSQPRHQQPDGKDKRKKMKIIANTIITVQKSHQKHNGDRQQEIAAASSQKSSASIPTSTTVIDNSNEPPPLYTYAPKPDVNIIDSMIEILSDEKSQTVGKDEKKDVVVSAPPELTVKVERIPRTDKDYFNDAGELGVEGEAKKDFNGMHDEERGKSHQVDWKHGSPHHGHHPNPNLPQLNSPEYQYAGVEFPNFVSKPSSDSHHRHPRNNQQESNDEDDDLIAIQQQPIQHAKEHIRDGKSGYHHPSSHQPRPTKEKYYTVTNRFNRRDIPHFHPSTHPHNPKEVGEYHPNRNDRQDHYHHHHHDDFARYYPANKPERDGYYDDYHHGYSNRNHHRYQRDAKSKSEAFLDDLTPKQRQYYEQHSHHHRHPKHASYGDESYGDESHEDNNRRSHRHSEPLYESVDKTSSLFPPSRSGRNDENAGINNRQDLRRVKSYEPTTATTKEKKKKKSLFSFLRSGTKKEVKRANTSNDMASSQRRTDYYNKNIGDI